MAHRNMALRGRIICLVSAQPVHKYLRVLISGSNRVIYILSLLLSDRPNTYDDIMVSCCEAEFLRVILLVGGPWGGGGGGATIHKLFTSNLYPTILNRFTFFS